MEAAHSSGNTWTFPAGTQFEQNEEGILWTLPSGYRAYEVLGSESSPALSRGTVKCNCNTSGPCSPFVVEINGQLLPGCAGTRSNCTMKNENPGSPSPNEASQSFLWIEEQNPGWAAYVAALADVFVIPTVEAMMQMDWASAEELAAPATAKALDGLAQALYGGEPASAPEGPRVMLAVGVGNKKVLMEAPASLVSTGQVSLYTPIAERN